MARARTARLACLVVMVLSVVSVAPAAIIVDILDPTPPTLQELMALPQGQGYLVGDKLFSDFTWLDSSQGGANPPRPEAINVQGVLVHYPHGSEHGLRFTGFWAATGGQLVDTLITFNVTATGNDHIIDNTLWMPNGDGSAGGLAAITETAYDGQGGALPGLDQFGREVIGKFVFASDDAQRRLHHVEYYSAHETLQIRKDIGVNGGGTGVAAISEFFQTFSQVPEPSSLLVLVAGAALIIRRRR